MKKQYLSLARSNIKRNLKFYRPYTFSFIITVAMFYISGSFASNPVLRTMPSSSEAASTAMKIECGAMVVFSCIFLFCVNRFLVKHRKKEMEQSAFSDMEKEKLAPVLLCEYLYIWPVSIGAGIGIGVLLDKPVYALLSKLTRTDVYSGFRFSSKTVCWTLLLFGTLFYILYHYSLKALSQNKPTKQFHGSGIAEKLYRAYGIVGLLGVGCVGLGYAVALNRRDQDSFSLVFFVALLLVTVGTYMLFYAGGALILKCLKRSNGFCAQTERFSNASLTDNRMKKNAKVLGSIALLCAMVMVMISSTVTFWRVHDKHITASYPYDYRLEIHSMGNQKEYVDPYEVMNRIRAAAKEENIKITRADFDRYWITTGQYDRVDSFVALPEKELQSDEAGDRVCILSEGYYRQITGNKMSLKEKEVALFADNLKYTEKKLNLFGETFSVAEGYTKQASEWFRMYSGPQDGILFTVIVQNSETVKMLYDRYKEAYRVCGEEPDGVLETICGIDVDARIEQKARFGNKLEQAVSQDPEGEKDFWCHVMNKEAEGERDYLFFGSLLFLGLYLGVLFVIAIMLIMRYEQIPAGCEDQERSQSLRMVGMSDEQIRRTVRLRTLIMFFLPLVMAGIHTALAYPVVHKLMLNRLWGMKIENHVVVSLGTFLVFALVYTLICLLTARVYYRIVRASKEKISH